MSHEDSFYEEMIMQKLRFMHFINNYFNLLIILLFMWLENALFNINF